MIEAGSIVDELERRFGSDEALGVDYSDEEESRYHDGSAAVVCTNGAVQVMRAMPERTRIYGFSEQQNPTARIVTQEQTGHDFAVVDDRYVVDPWIKLVPMLLDRAVFDMQDPADAAIVLEWYGQRGCWTRMTEAERPLRSASAQQRLHPDR